MWWTEGYYPEIKSIGNKFWTGILYVLRFTTVWEIIQCCLNSKGYKGFGPAHLSFLKVEKILREGKIMQNLPYLLLKTYFQYI